MKLEIEFSPLLALALQTTIHEISRDLPPFEILKNLTTLLILLTECLLQQNRCNNIIHQCTFMNCIWSSKQTLKVLFDQHYLDFADITDNLL